eukprot:gene12273-5857_t
MSQVSFKSPFKLSLEQILNQYELDNSLKVIKATIHNVPSLVTDSLASQLEEYIFTTEVPDETKTTMKER